MQMVKHLNKISNDSPGVYEDIDDILTNYIYICWKVIKLSHDSRERQQNCHTQLEHHPKWMTRRIFALYTIGK
jgi:hypothetical protein